MQASSEQTATLAQFLPPVELGGGRFFEASTSPESAPYSVAILEGSVSLARLLATGLSAESIRVEIYEDLESVTQFMETTASNLLILDLDLEGIDGVALLAKLRALQPSMRLLALSGRAGMEWAVKALNHGADDYLVKPFSLLEMMARVRALRRRSGDLVQARPTDGKLSLNTHQGCVTCQGHSINLTSRECKLLEFMMANPGTILSRATLSQQVWNMPAEANTNIVDVYVKYLRDKLKSAFNQKLIRTVRGEGYVFQHQS